jgi:signal transduction histidine kinase
VLDNAVKFTPAGGSVTVSVAVEPEFVEIAVRDTGPGVPPDELDRATDRFWRSPGTAASTGRGWGSRSPHAPSVEPAGGDSPSRSPRG